MALWDIKGKTLGVPVYQLLGGACRDRVQTFATVPWLGDREAVQRARELVHDGWQYLRFLPAMPEGTPEDIFEPMESIHLMVQRIRDVRQEVGPTIGLSIDFHHRLSIAETAHFCSQIEDIHLMFLEEPIRAQSPAAYRQLRRLTNVPFAVGEEASNKWELAPFIEDGLIQFSRIDVTYVGGHDPGEEVCRLVRGALHRHHAPQSAWSRLHRRQRPSLRGNEQCRSDSSSSTTSAPRSHGASSPQIVELDGD